MSTFQRNLLLPIAQLNFKHKVFVISQPAKAGHVGRHLNLEDAQLTNEAQPMPLTANDKTTKPDHGEFRQSELSKHLQSLREAATAKPTL